MSIFNRLTICVIVLCCAVFAPSFVVPAKAAYGVVVSFNLFSPPPVAVAPPPLPVYVVPPPPTVGYIWTPGHWRWGDYGYFWVPGTWVQPPAVGLLWTPGYWGWREGVFAWNEGYWAPHVGYYGGIAYGGGYGGVGFVGGAWDHGVFNVNRSVINLAVVNHASFAGGPGGTTVVPTVAEQRVAAETHYPLTAAQQAHFQAASQNPALALSANHGKPSIAAVARAGDFTHDVVPTREAGPRNLVAEQHNAAVRKDPSLAKGGAMPQDHAGRANPKAHSGDHAQGAHAQGAHLQGQAGAPREEEHEPQAEGRTEGGEHEHHERQ